jgi:hypothetical protein
MRVISGVGRIPLWQPIKDRVIANRQIRYVAFFIIEAMGVTIVSILTQKGSENLNY